MSSIQLGCSPLSWINSDIPSLGNHFSVETILEQIASIGYSGVELEDPFRKVIDVFPDLLNRYNLRLIGGWHSTFLLEKSYNDELESLKCHLETLSHLNADRVILAECSGANHRIPDRGLSGRPQLTDRDWDRLGDLIDRLADYAISQNFITAYHPHMGTVVQSGHDIEMLMKSTQRLGLLIDTGHLMFAGENPLEIAKQHLKRIKHVHCKNVRYNKLRELIADDESFFTAILEGAFTVPGDPDGAGPAEGMDFEGLIRLLARNDYNGWLVMEAEQDPLKADPYVYAETGFNTLKKYLKECYQNNLACQ